ncbi:alpha-amylase family protein [Occultella gossypii]|uniref:Alpha-amylase family protein n=1 Tax=Occultella gossypii TaxID=2800820 RepID=A0ABS7SIG9_9MICO|nr:alpha-amylase family protein [Occultella gossypii]MBZ2199073.1 alpha-amylase family protein [Occultella gossypii]
MNTMELTDLWWKNATIYCLDVETYLDWDADGAGDFKGLAQRLDHLTSLGVSCLWLMPFYPGGGKDDGYDVTDFYGVDPRVGSLGDFVDLMRLAKERGLRVIVDLVVNHTSDQHPWFRSARRSKDSPHRDYYVWRADEPPDTSAEVVFPDQEDGIWELDDRTGEYYLHHFYRHEPDLNVANPVVRHEIAKVMGYWLQLGVSGFRVDSAPFLIGAMDGAGGKGPLDPHGYMKALRSFLNRRSGEAILLGEVDLSYPEQLEYFGGSQGDELTMVFDFNLMQRTYLALARRTATPIREALKARPDIPAEAQWATFLRSHDELTLDLLSEAERQEVFDVLGPEEDMQIYGRGLRRRLPPMLEGDERRIRLAYSLPMSMPGTPVLFYGEEIGMGENLEEPDRYSVRTPMQWGPGPFGDFSRANTRRIRRRPPKGSFAPEHVNVDSQQKRPDSLLAFFTQMIHRRHACPEFGFGRLELLETGTEQVLAHRCSWDEGSVLALHNLGPDALTATLHLPDAASAVVADLFGGDDIDLDERGHAGVEMQAYGYRWLRIKPPGRR